MSVSVQEGDLLFKSHGHSDHLHYVQDTMVGNQTFSGYLTDVQRALGSLLYVPNRDYNSFVDLDLEDTRTVLTYSVSSGRNKIRQIITTSIDGNNGVIMVNDMDSSYFQLNLSCNNYARAMSLFINESAIEQEYEFSYLMGSDISAVDMQERIGVLFEKCNFWISRQILQPFVNSTQNHASTLYIQPTDVSVTSSNEGGDEHGKGVYTWVVELNVPPLHSPFPAFNVHVDNVILSTGSASAKVEVEVIHTSNLPTGSFTLKLGDSVTDPIDITDSSSESIRQSILASDILVNSEALVVKKSDLSDTLKGHYGYTIQMSIIGGMNWNRCATQSVSPYYTESQSDN